MLSRKVSMAGKPLTISRKAITVLMFISNLPVDIFFDEKVVCDQPQGIQHNTIS